MSVLITIWELYTKDEDEVYRWHHNHISDDYDPKLQTPNPKFPSQAGWKRGTWKSIPALLVDDVVIRI